STTSEVLELRRPFFEERQRSFLRVGVREDLAADLLLVSHHLVPAVAEVVGDRLAHSMDCDRRGLGDPRCDLKRFFPQRDVRHDPGDEAQLISLGRAEVLADEEQVERVVAADVARQAQQAHAPARNEAEIGVARAKDGILRGDTDVACPAERGAAADAVAVDRGDDGLRETRDPVERAPPELAERPRLRGIAKTPLLAQIGAGTERLLSGAREHDAAYFLVLLDLVQYGVKPLDELHRKGVYRRIVERQRRDPVAPLDEDEVGHGWSPGLAVRGYWSRYSRAPPRRSAGGARSGRGRGAPR